jgi:hypothetical protein
MFFSPTTISLGSSIVCDWIRFVFLTTLTSKQKVI